MERDEILNMPAGTKINQLVWWKIFDMSPTPPNNDMLLLQDYSNNMHDAWSVILALKEKGYQAWLENDQVYKDFPGQTNSCKLYGNGFVYFALGETMPLAICRVALLAMPR